MNAQAKSQTLSRNDDVIALLRVMLKGQESLEQVPGLIKQVIENGMWQERIINDSGQRVTYADFVRFIEDPPLEGLGTNVKLIYELCRGTEAQKLIDGLIPAVGEHGGDRRSSSRVQDGIANLKTANTAEYVIARLKRDNPALAERVINGELSANAAAKQAGFRKERISVPNDDMRLAAKALATKLDDEQISELIALLVEHLEGTDE